MTIPFYCLVVMLLLAVLTKLPVAVAMHKVGARGYDNRHPRAQQAQLTGWGARALAAHQNTFEAIILFAPAVMVAHLAGGPGFQDRAATLSIVHTVARVIFPIAYIADVHWARSLVWFVGYTCTVLLALLPAF